MTKPRTVDRSKIVGYLNTTPLSEADIRRAGEVVLVAIGNAAAMGHNSPNGMLEYVPRPDDEIGAAVWDAFVATRMGSEATEASTRLWEFAERRGLLDLIADAVSR